MQRRCGGLYQHSVPIARFLSSNKPPKGNAPPTAVKLCHVAKGAHGLTYIFSGWLSFFFCYACLLLNWVFRFRKVFPKEWRKHRCQQISWRWEHFQALFLHPLFSLHLQCVTDVFDIAVLDENTKEQGSHVTEDQAMNDDGDERQRGGKKEESHWWTRFQV